MKTMFMRTRMYLCEDKENQIKIANDFNKSSKRRFRTLEKAYALSMKESIILLSNLPDPNNKRYSILKSKRLKVRNTIEGNYMCNSMKKRGL